MNNVRFNSEFRRYLASLPNPNDDSMVQLPSLNEISQELGVSVASLREQLEAAKALGFVDVRPRTGIRRLPFSFLPAVRQTLSYAMDLDAGYFYLFADLRNHIEAAYWSEAVVQLTPEDHQELLDLMARAWVKLHSPRVEIPHVEHRQLHLTIFKRLDNPFVLGILEAYWEAYVAVGLNLFADYDYLQQVWAYHQKMVDCICAGEYDQGYRALVEHRDLLHHRAVRSLTENTGVQISQADGKPSP
jgi:DNA-binding FadR family transcriptional regulator